MKKIFLSTSLFYILFSQSVVAGFELPEITLGNKSAYTIELTDNKNNPTSYYTEINLLENSYIAEAKIKTEASSHNRIDLNTEYNGQDITSHFFNLSGIAGGAIRNNKTIGNVTGDFIDNKSTYAGWANGGAITNVLTIGNIIGDFISNSVTGNSTDGGAMFNSARVGNITGNFIGNKSIATIGGYGGGISNTGTINNLDITAIGNFVTSSRSGYGGMLSSNGTIHNIEGLFIGNSAVTTGTSYSSGGGAIHISGGQQFFKGTVVFQDNYAKAVNIANAKGGAVFHRSGTMVFSPQTKGQYILFENNFITNGSSKNLSSIHFNSSSVATYFLLQEGTYAEIKDPITGNGTIIKDKAVFYDENNQVITTGKENGGGHLFLWGNNDSFTGKMNVNTGHLYMLFDENSPYTQRQTATIAAEMNFAANTVFRPQITDKKLAAITGTINAHPDMLYLPYGLSKLEIDTYNYSGNNTTGFKGWNNELSTLVVGPNTQVVIKRDLDGYKGLSFLADKYRRLETLGYEDRFLFDELYATGVVSDALKYLLQAVEGEDLVAFEQMHRGTIRQFNRQISSRIHNRNCDGDDCNTNGYTANDHFWVNVGYNWMDKDNASRHVGYTYNPTSIAFGYDHDIIDEKLNIGIALGHSFGMAKSDNGLIRSENDIKEYLFSLYAKYKLDRLHFAAMIGYGTIRNETAFVTDSINAKGKYNSNAYFAYLETGYNLGIGTFLLEPYAAIDYTSLHTEKHDEQGVGGRHFDAMSWNVVELPVGVRISKDIDLKELIFTPMADISYARNFGNDNTKTSAHFVNSPGSVWRVSSSADKRDTLRLGFNLKINSKKNAFALNFGYAVDYRSDYTDNQIYGTIRWDF